MKLKLSNFSKNSKLFLAANFFFSFGMNIFFVFFNLYLLKKGINEQQIGSIASIAALSGGIGILLVSPYLSSIKHIKSLKIAVICAVSAIFGFTMTADFNNLMGLAVIYGMTTAFFTTMQVPISMEIVKQSMRKYYFAISTAMFILNGTLATLFTGYFPDFMIKYFIFSEGRAYDLVLENIAFSLLISLCILFFVKEHEKIDIERVVLLKNIQDLPLKKFFIIGMPTLLVGLGAGLMVPLFNVYFKQKLDFSLKEISIIFMVSQLLMGLFTLLTPILSKKFRPVTFILLTQALSIPFILLIINTRSIFLVTMAFTLRASLMNMSRPIQSHFEMACFKTKYRAAFAAFKAFFWNISWAISTLAAGYFQFHKMFDIPLYLSFLLYIVMLLFVFIRFYKKEEDYLHEIGELSHF